MTGIPGSARTLPPDGLTAEADPNLSEGLIQVTMVLRAGGNADALRQENPTRNELREAHRPSLFDLQKVVDFARRHSLTVVELDRPPRMVVLQGTVNNIKTAFGTDVKISNQIWPWPDGQAIQPPTPVPFRLRSEAKLQVPDDLAQIVEGVFGIDNRKEVRMQVWADQMRIWAAQMRIWNAQGQTPAAQTQIGAATVANPDKLPGQPHSYTVEEVAERYNFPVAGAKGRGQTVAILSLGGRLNREEFAQYFRDGCIEVPEVFEVPVDCEPSQLGRQPDENVETVENVDVENVEVALDAHIIAALVPRARIVIYYTKNTSQGFINGLAQAIYNEYLPASIISISCGSYEESWTDQAKSVIEDLLLDAKALNITVCCASGDLGAWDGDPDGKLHVDFPASSPHVLSCGGTTLPPVDSGLREAVWSEPEVVWNQSEPHSGREEHLASGGGESMWFDKPDWQHQAGDPELGALTKRGVPDVAGFADPRNGFRISVSGQEMLVGGTSAAAPLWAGLIARINENLRSHVGHLNPLLYREKSRIAFCDITEGDNGKWHATEGWDRCTGLGRPDGTALLQALDEQLRQRLDTP